MAVLTRRIALLAAGASAVVAGLVAHALPGRSSPAPGSGPGLTGQAGSSPQLQAPQQAPAASSGAGATVTGPTQG